jgi:Arc/MetJ-type ribon-helix-helix transcriptional regulator
MKVVTVNVPESYIEAIKKLVGNDGLYPSRSELIRVAVRKFLLKELEMVKGIKRQKESKNEDDDTVKIPINKKSKKGDSIEDIEPFKHNLSYLKIIKYLFENKPKTTTQIALAIDKSRHPTKVILNKLQKKIPQILRNPNNLKDKYYLSEALLKEMAKNKGLNVKEVVKNLRKCDDPEKDLVKIPVRDKTGDNGEPIVEFKTYKIIRRLEH